MTEQKTTKKFVIAKPKQPSTTETKAAQSKSFQDRLKSAALCPVPGCLESPLPSRGSCAWHACKNPSCTTGRVANTPDDRRTYCPRCADQQCALKGCSNKIANLRGSYDSKYCVQHQPTTCKVCDKPIFVRPLKAPGKEGDWYPMCCTDHACKEQKEKCCLIAFGKDGKCVKHTETNCIATDCKQDLTGGGKFCTNHKCVFTDCPRGRNQGETCDWHRCYITGCTKPADKDGDHLCAEHAAGLEKCVRVHKDKSKCQNAPVKGKILCVDCLKSAVLRRKLRLV